MKKLILLLLLGTLALSTAFSQSNISVDVGAGLSYDAYPLSGTAFDLLLEIFNIRGGIHGDLNFFLSKEASVGVELGLAYMSATLDKGQNTHTSSHFDVPAYVIFRYRPGRLAIQPYSGILVTGSADTDGDFGTALYFSVGARVLFGGLFAEVSCNIGSNKNLQSFPRIGVGYQYNGLIHF